MKRRQIIKRNKQPSHSPFENLTAYQMEGLSIWSMLPKSDPQKVDVQEDEPEESLVPEAAPPHRASAEISQPRRRRVKPEMEKKHLQYLLKQEFKLSKPEERIEIMTHKIELIDNKRPGLPGVKTESDSDEDYYDAVPEYTVYTWGRGNDNVEVLPMDRLGLKQVECATDHNIGLTDMGEVMTWGSFSGETANNERNSLENGIEKLYSGPTMMAAVKKGKLWLWGTIETNFGKLDYSRPGQILFYDHNDERYYIAGIKHMSIGPSHLAVLAANNMVYTMGSNLYKELVHKKSSGRFGVQMRPIYYKKDYLHNVKISAVGCGPNYTVVGYGNHFVIWGRFNGTKCKEEVFELEGYRNDAIQDFICHANFLLILTDNGNVFGFGDNTTRMMGIGDNAIYAEIPMRLNFAHNDKSYRIVSIRSGGEHFVAVDDTGRIWTWGRCEGGRLGYFPLQYSQDESSLSQDSGSGSVVSAKSDKSGRKKRRSHRSAKKSDNFLENGYVPAVAPNNVQTVPRRVEQMEGQFVAHVSCTATGCMALGRDRVFGEYLHKLAAKTENWMPTFLEKLFSLLESRHVDQNILKVPGNVKLVNATRDNIDKGLAYDIGKMDTEDLIALLKLYLSELPNPLLSSTLTEEWNKIKRVLSAERRLEKYHKMLSKLPTAHKEVLLRLLKWCYLLSVEHRARTKLFPKHIAKVFGPYLAHVKNPVLINNFIGILEDMIEHTLSLNVKSPPPRPLPKPKSRSSSRSASPVRSLSPSDASSSDSDSPNRQRSRSVSSPAKSSASSSSSGKKPKPLPLPKPKNRAVSPVKQLPKPPTKAAPTAPPKVNSVPKPATAGSNSHVNAMNTTNFDYKLNALQSQFDDLMKARQEYEELKNNQPNPVILQLYQHQARQQTSLKKAVEKQREQAHKRIIIEEEEPSDNESSEDDEDMRREPVRPKSPRVLNREGMRTNVPKRPLPSGFKSRYNSDRLTASQRQELEQMLNEEESKQTQGPKIYFDKPPARPQLQPAKSNGRPISQRVSDDHIQQMIHGLQHGFKPPTGARQPQQQHFNRPAASNNGAIVMPPMPIRPKKPRNEAPSHVRPPLAAGPKKMVNSHAMPHVAGPNQVHHIRPPVKQPQSRVSPTGTNSTTAGEGRFVVQNNQQFVKFGGKLIPRALPVSEKKTELPPQYEKKPVDYDGLEKVIYPSLTQLVQTHPNLRQETVPHLEHLQECFERLEEVKPGLALSFVARVFETLQEQ